MLAAVRGVGNDVGHTHGRTCKIKTLTPAKAMPLHDSILALSYFSVFSVEVQRRSLHGASFSISEEW